MSIRFSRITAISMRGLLQGSSDTSSDLLRHLSEHCKHVTALDITGAYCSGRSANSGWNSGSLEEQIVQLFPALQSLTMTTQCLSIFGLTLVLQGCKQLHTLHLAAFDEEVKSFYAF
jgi:hypothetical protein